MPVFLFDLLSEDGSSNTLLSQSARKQAIRTLQAIEENQQPQVSFYQAPNAIQIGDISAPLAVFTPTDALDKLPGHIDLGILYKLLTNEGLAGPSIATPTGLVVNVDLPSTNPNTEGSSWKEAWKSREIHRITREVSKGRLPYVIKFIQALSGCGVYIVKTDVQYQELLDQTLPTALDVHLPRLSSTKAHLEPCNVVLTPLSEDAISNYSLTFFVIKKEHGWMFNCCGAHHVHGTSYEGATANYEAQALLKCKMSKTINAIADFVSGKGYVGPFGADVLEDGDGKQWVIGLDVRWNTS